MTNRFAEQLADSAAIQLRHDPFGQLVLTLPDGAEHTGVVPIRGFPISAPNRGLSLTSAEGKEIFWIEDLAKLPVSTRAILEAELHQSEFLPQIRRVISLSLETDPCQWEVETDRGPTKFLLKNRDDIRRLRDNQALVIDAHGIRYLIPDTKSLDRHSRRLLERYL
ncbi:MAG TPA: DUF1854 domain-containing protein [Pirellulales bacterium]|jgi:hypothetical protein